MRILLKVMVNVISTAVPYEKSLLMTRRFREAIIEFIRGGDELQMDMV